MSVTPPPVRWGFIGAGYVASRAMAPAVHGATGAVLHAVASRDPQRSALLEPVTVHRSYRDLLNDDQIDAVYISLRNGQHREWVIAALEAGCHVLCEKPLALSAIEAAAMYETAAKHNRLLVEAVWAHWHPRFQRMIALAHSGSLGELKSISSSFTFTGTEMEGNYRLDPTQGGGALLDVGCYQTHTWLALLGHDASHLVNVDIEDVTVEIGPTGVDLSTSVTAQLQRSDRATPVTATQTSSFVMPATQQLRVTGDVANMATGEGEAFTNWKAPSSLVIGEVEEHFEPVDPFQLMVESVGARLTGDTNPAHDLVPVANSLRVAEILDQIAVAIRPAGSRDT
jgi:D-xylose 1-dehydrogenase (NADP+, D-xylono-1,5-lactone-forming)